MARAVDSVHSESRRNFLRGKIAKTPSAATPGAPGLALVSDACLAGHNVACQACGDQCEAAAIRFRPRLGGAARPEVNAERCTGCAECLAVCPTQAISITYGQAQHTSNPRSPRQEAL